MLSAAEEMELLTLLEAEAAAPTRPFTAYYPDTGPLRRDLYPRHMEFFAAGPAHRLRLALGANKIGKTEGIGGYEMTLHLTGRYPAWWQGVRFDHPIRAWAVGETSQTTRDILQTRLLGAPGELGRGLIPPELILDTMPKKSGVSGAIETAMVRHVAGGASRLVFKSYDQKRVAFQGELQHVVWLDEEAPLAVHAEAHLRIMPTASFIGGILLNTFTPLQGLSETVLEYLPDGQLPTHAQTDMKYIVNITWDDVPHLSEADKAAFLAAIPPYQRDARTRGLPVLGAGAIYPVPEDDYLVDPFQVPIHWRKAYAMDVGWNRTAALWGAYDPEQDRWTLYHEHYGSHAEPSIHATAVKAPGTWIRGVIDPAARGRSQRDGRQLIADYRDLGLDLTEAVNTVEAGLYQVWERLSTGRLKVFRTLSNWVKECRLYHRDEHGTLVKKDDHLMDCTRYLVMSGAEVAQVQPVGQTAYYQLPPAPLFDARGWQGG
jgi:phage terminase large subunit-like protein